VVNNVNWAAPENATIEKTNGTATPQPATLAAAP
jgi:hypothetical protein